MTILGGILERLGVHAAPRAEGFLAWWKRSLAAWLPVRWQVLLGLARDRLLLSSDGQGLQVQLESAGQLRELARLPAAITRRELDALLGPRLSQLRRWLLLPGDSSLRRDLRLPAAAADRLLDVVGFEIDRQTPFTADAVRFDARIVGRRADGQLEVELVAVPRARFDAGVAALHDMAQGLAGVDLAGPDGVALGVNLMPPAQRREMRRPWLRKLLPWAVVVTVLLALAGHRLLENRRAAAEAFAAEVETRAAQARQVAAQRQSLVDLVEGAAFLDRTRAARPAVIEVLAELSRRLPDGTWLEKLSIEGDRLLLVGQSSDASGLVARLEGTPLWRSPALAGALQPDPRSGRDRFTLTADLVAPAPVPAPAPASAPRAEAPATPAAEAAR